MHEINGLEDHTGKTINVDTRYEATGWNITIFSAAQKGGKAYLNQMLPSLPRNIYQDFHFNNDANQATRIFPAETTEPEIATVLNAVLRDLVTKSGYGALGIPE